MNVIRLFDYQKDICNRTVEAFRSHRSVMVQMPTGTGKTVVLASLVNEELRVKKRKFDEVNEECSPFHSVSGLDLSVSGEMCILIVAHRRELVEQIRETIHRLGIDDGNITVCSIQWLTYNINKVKKVPSLVVIDEAHHALAKTYRMMWETWHEARFLGLTATPCRMNRAGFTDLFECLVMSWSIGQFIKEGWLSLFDYYSIKADSEEQRIIDTLEKRGADGDYQAKELNAVLNRKPSIERLYESVVRYAEGKKGIVYAINIDHAHNIAEYYREHGVNAVAIDSRTPADVRRLMVEDFKAGKIKVMVSVDLFSEGFDCPDVEFIQLARPTLSLAKYLQMVGRGLRKSDGKETCVMIDNVGLYRMFGLPAADRDWQAMFEGRMAGKGSKARDNAVCNYAMTVNMNSIATVDVELDEVISHESLLERLWSGSLQTLGVETAERLRTFRDCGSGLYGLKTGDKIIATPQYLEVFDIKDGLAAVRFEDRRTGIIDGDGNIIMKLKRYAGIKMAGNDIIAVKENNGPKAYIDLRNGMCYGHLPTPVRFGNIEMLRVNGIHYCRTKIPHEDGFIKTRCHFKNGGFYLAISPRLDSEWGRVMAKLSKLYGFSTVCILANDDSDWYNMDSELDDGSIIITDKERGYYHVEDGKEKRYIGNRHSKDEERELYKIVERLERHAKTKGIRRQEEKKAERMMRLQNIEPFSLNNKWGLRLDGRVIVPPIYRSIKEPVGNYCAVEISPRQWGVILLNGQVVIEPKYEAVEINVNGSAELTIFKGKTKKVRLNTATV